MYDFYLSPVYVKLFLPTMALTRVVGFRQFCAQSIIYIEIFLCFLLIIIASTHHAPWYLINRTRCSANNQVQLVQIGAFMKIVSLLSFGHHS